jgi:hypothetical protein
VGGPWGFGQILFRGVLGVVRKSGGGALFSCFIAFYVTFFRTLPHDYGWDRVILILNTKKICGKLYDKMPI